MIIEEWRPIPGFEGYEVSSLGRGRSWRGRGGAERAEPKYLKGRPNPKGYLRLNLCSNGRTYDRYVHRLVPTAFVGPCPPGKEGAHKNGHLTDNRLCNLAWKTHQQNIDDQIEHGSRRIGSAHHNSKLDEGLVEQLKYVARHPMYDLGQAQLGRAFGVSQTNVGRILRGEMWGHVE